MKENFGYIPKKERKKVLLLCDDIRMHSGIGTMGKEIIINTAHHFNWINLGAGIKHPDVGKILDLSQDINKHTGLEDSNVRVIPNNGYGSPEIIRSLIKSEKPDALLIFTDPRYWVWLFEMEREIRAKIPIFYLNIWDNYPAPMYNRNYYRSVDLLMAISKQTKVINEEVLGDEKNEKVIGYVPHGINEKIFYPITETDKEYKTLNEFKKKVVGNDLDFIIFHNSRNIRRKCTADLILGYRMFCDLIGKDKAKKCALVMHTELVHEAGTDLLAVKQALCDPSYVNVYFSTEKYASNYMNYLYNISDATIMVSSNEGWGLSLTESMMAGKMIISNVTGGMQDQLRFEDENGNWFEPSSSIPSNHLGTYKKCGEWAVPIFPACRTLIGSPPTPYIFEDHVNPEDIAKGILTVYDLPKEERKQRGMKGRQWVTSEESGMSAKYMAENVIKYMNLAFEKFTPRERFELILTKERPSNLIEHKITSY